MESLSSPQSTRSTIDSRPSFVRNSSVPSRESEVQMAILMSGEER